MSKKVLFKEVARKRGIKESAAMVVYGKRKTKYILSKKPIRGNGESAIYPVSERDDILVKIYQKAMRTTEKEYQVMEAINGTGSMLEEYPIDMVYERGKFVGYTFEKEEVYAPPVEKMVQPSQNFSEKEKIHPITILVLNIIIGIILSIVVYFGAFPKMSQSISDENLLYYFNGITMIVGGWIGLICTLVISRCINLSSIILSILGFVFGNIIVFGVTWLIVTLFRATVAIIWAFLPTVLTILIVVWVIRAILH